MLFIVLLAVFGAGALVTSALAYDELRWRYAIVVTVACAVILAAWTARLLAAALGWLSWDLHPAIALLISAVPYGAVVFSLWTRRRHTPRHVPGLDDDPVLRRHVAEKLRRLRRRRQLEAQEEAAGDDSSFT
jgi:hypothetical protein